MLILNSGIDINLQVFDIIVLLGMAQGFICAGLLFLHQPLSINKRTLACILLTFLLLSFKILLHTLGLWQKPFWRYLPLGFDLLIQPLFYLYTLSLTQKNFRLNRKFFIHFIPVILFLIHAIGVYALTQQTDIISTKDQLAERWYYNRIKVVEDILSVISGIVYWYLSFRQVQAYKQWLISNISNASYPNYSWLRNVMLAMGIFVLILAINIFLELGFSFGASHFIQWQFFYFYLAVLVYYLGFSGYQQKDFEVAFQPEKRPAVAIDKTQVLVIKERLLKAIDTDKVYLDPELSLSTLANKIGVSDAMLSAVINEEFRQNFRNFINEKRVEEVKLKLGSPSAKHLSILGVALESGFNSEASFYRVFKSVTGQSPKDFLLKK